MYEDEHDSQIYLLLVEGLLVHQINVESLEILQSYDLQQFLKVKKIKKYDQIIKLAAYNLRSNLLAVAYANQEIYLFKLGSDANFYYKIPSNELPLSMCFSPLGDKLALSYDSNNISVIDTLNRCLHPWSKQNSIPTNFLKRYTRLLGSVALTGEKFLFYSNYTYCVLDL